MNARSNSWHVRRQLGHLPLPPRRIDERARVSSPLLLVPLLFGALARPERSRSCCYCWRRNWCCHFRCHSPCWTCCCSHHPLARCCLVKDFLDVCYMCPRLEGPCSPPGGGHQIQAGETALGYRKDAFHIGEHLIFQIRRVSMTRSASIVGPPGGTVPSCVMWALPNRQTLQMHWSQHEWPRRLHLKSNQTLHTEVF